MGGHTNLFTKTNKCEQFSFSGCEIRTPLCKKYCLTKYMLCVNYLEGIEPTMFLVKKFALPPSNKGQVSNISTCCPLLLCISNTVKTFLIQLIK